MSPTPRELEVDGHRVVITDLPQGVEYTILRMDKQPNLMLLGTDAPEAGGIHLPTESRPIREWIPPMGPRPPTIDGVEVETGLILATKEVPVWVKNVVVVVDGSRVTVDTPEDVRQKVRALLPPEGPTGPTPESQSVLQRFVGAFLGQFGSAITFQAVRKCATQRGRLVRCAGPYERGEVYLDANVREDDIVHAVTDLLSFAAGEKEREV